jgi:hypothetical protein
VVLIDRDLSIEQFDYSQPRSDWAALTLLASLGASLGRAPGTHLVVELGLDDGDLFYAPARNDLVERRLLGKKRGSELLWNVTFDMPLEVVQAPRAMFRLLAENGAAVALPAPWQRDLAPAPLQLSLAGERRRSAPRISLRAPRRIAALGTAVALTGTSAPALALAAGVAGTGVAAGVSRSAGSGQTGFALDRHQTTAKAKANRWPTRQNLGAPSSTTETSAAATTSTSTTSTSPTSTSTTSTSTTAPTRTSPTTTSGGAPTGTTTITVTTPTTTTTTTAQPGQTTTRRQAPDCTTPTRQDLLAVTTQLRADRVKKGLGLGRSTRALPEHCTQTGPPKAGHQHPTTKPGHQHQTKRTHKQHPTPTGGHHQSTPQQHRPSRVSGGAPLSPPTKQPDNVLAPSPSSSHPSTGGAPEKPVPTLSPQPSFVTPRSWTGTVTADPTLTGAVRNLSGLLTNGDRPPSFLIPIYMQAAKRYGIPWPVLAAINAVESDYGRNLSTSSAGALGWMQFEPGTWTEYGVSADGRHNPNPYDPRDAIFAAAKYLKAAGGSSNITKAIYAYNHAGWYVDMVMSRAQRIAHHAQYLRAKADKHGTYSVYFATGLKKHPTVRYSGGVLSHFTRLIAAANMVSAANFPYLYGGGHEQPARWGAFDCSGSVSYIMQQAGYTVPTTVSGAIPTWKFPAGPGTVTIFYNPVHTFMRIGNRYFGTSGFARPGGGAGWFDVDKLPADYLATFRTVHVPNLGPDSFAPGQNYVWPKAPKASQVPVGLPRTIFRREQR